MNKLIQDPVRSLFFKAVAMAGLLTACAPGLEKKPTQLDTASIKQIEFKIGTIRQPSLKSTLAQQDVANRISKNLAGWGYPTGAKDNQVFSHTLTAEIGLIEHSETPPGFSFSSGNSDPRALDFQKSEVLPIGCELTSIEQPTQTTYLYIDFAAGSSTSAAQLVDHISTVCFNLLSELNWPDKTQNQPSSSLKPSWIPEVRIETVTNPAEAEKADAPVKADEGRKQIIIHNQGTPVILKFGHERL
ncbi:MAG: hypothetical protein Q8L79_06780 [Methylobacter sp.]|uniref:hypothetical protein n=1 Tax=Methylobacter sp. TaxID=2051955 RepID=UPI00273080CF|nr:hypothetical protein [Methylobacter sp.]MDP1664818.1 hypothetical protein [Methylobacter sp.]